MLRRTGRTWWIWGAVVTMAFMAFVATIGPVYMAPLFNTYKPLENRSDPRPILRMAHANGIADERSLGSGCVATDRRASAPT